VKVDQNREIGFKNVELVNGLNWESTKRKGL